MTTIKNYNVKENELHPFHLVRPSPWPLTVSSSLAFFLMGLVKYFHRLDNASLFLHIGTLGLCFSLYNWFRDIVYEATFEGHHTQKVRRGIRLGFILFIISEVMFFGSFFFAWFFFAWSPNAACGCVWPPIGIQTIDPLALPLANTAILIWSATSVTWGHRGVASGSKKESGHGLFVTILVGVIFTFLQYLEYSYAPFSITDGIYGSLFYMMTGFHGIHVIIGTIFLFVCLIRTMKRHFTKKTHQGLTFAVWYWHFVDVVWVLLYAFVYCWEYW